MILALLLPESIAASTVIIMCSKCNKDDAQQLGDELSTTDTMVHNVSAIDFIEMRFADLHYQEARA